MKNISNILQKNGFSEKEALVYLSVLRYREATISQVARNTHIKRTSVYNTMQALKSRGLLSITTRKNTQFISAVSPDFLVEKLMSHAQAAQGVLPEMLKIANSGGRLPKVEFFDGIEGIKNCYGEIRSGELMGFTDYESMPEEVFNTIYKTTIPLQKKHDIPARFLVSNNAKNKSIMNRDDDKYFVHHRVFPNLEQTKNIEFFLANQSDLVFLSYRPDEVFAIRIRSKSVFEILKNIFEACWLSAKS